jgi:FkbM family methyltransferase
MENQWLESAVDAYRKHFGDTAKVVFDIGTRDGDDAEYFRQKLNATEIYVFDANPLAIEETKRRYPDFNIFETAVGNFNGRTSFTQIVSDHEGEAGCSSIKSIHNFRGAQKNDIIVKITRLDSFLAEQGKSDIVIDVLKIDVEGFSWEVLQGMGNVISNVKLIHLETETFDRHAGHQNNNAIIDYMNKNNFICVDKSYEWGPTIEDQVWINQRFM